MNLFFKPACRHVLVYPFPGHILAAMLGHCGTGEILARRQYRLSFRGVFKKDFHEGRHCFPWRFQYDRDFHFAFFIGPRH